MEKTQGWKYSEISDRGFILDESIKIYQNLCHGLCLKIRGVMGQKEITGKT